MELDTYHRLFLASPDVVMFSRLSDGTFIDVNPDFERFTGIRREEAIGRPSLKLNLGIDAADRERMITALIVNREILGFRTRQRGSDGKIHEVEISATLAEIDDDRTIIGIVRDVTEWQWVNLHAGLDSTLNIVNNEIKYKANVVKAYENLPDIECLPLELNQVFMNMLVNAAQVIEQFGEIRIRTGAHSNQVWIAFEDNGAGITPENLKRIFDPFFTTTTSRQRHRARPLAVVQHWAKAQGTH